MLMALSVGLTACDETGGGGSGGGTTGNWGDKITVTSGRTRSEYANMVFTYDGQGRIIKVNYEEHEGDEMWLYTVNYTYGQDRITEEWLEYEGDVVVDRDFGIWMLNNKGLISSYTEEYDDGSVYESYYQYDSNGYLTSFVDDNSNYEIKWQNGNMVDYNGRTKLTYYTDKSDAKGVNGLSFSMFDDFGLLYMQGYFGKKSANLLKEYGHDVYTYTFDGDKVKTARCHDTDDVDDRYDNVWTFYF